MTMKFVYMFVRNYKKNVTVECECKKDKVCTGDDMPQKIENKSVMMESYM